MLIRLLSRLKSTKLRAANEQRDRGDRHRDAREWAQAVASYGRYLESWPNDAAIFVQFGHSLKECGNFEAAEKAYRTAASLAPDDDDVKIHLGHLLKQQGKITEALEMFRALSIESKGDDINQEMKYLRIMAQSELPLKKSTIEYLYSIQDMLLYLSHHPTMTGIQRVQAGITLALMAMRGVDVGFIITDFTDSLEKGSFWLLRNEDIKALLSYAGATCVELEKLKKLISDCQYNASPITAGEGNTIILTGAFWGLENTIDRYLPAKLAGARIGVYIYDIIPISHPQYCEAEFTREFALGIGDILLISDYIFTISDYTRSTMIRHIVDVGGRIIPMATVPLAHSLTGPPAKLQGWPQSMRKLRGRKYVAYISTIEGRKNHLYVVNVWRKLIDSGIDVPDLVFVGRKGWRISGLLELLDGTRNLGGRVHMVHDLTDPEVNAVYQNSMFTVFTSFVEGWGLPVGESLMHHVPCVASRTSSIPEVGGEFVDYVDPENLQDGVEVIGRMITDQTYLAARRQNIINNFNPRSWNDVATLFVTEMRNQASLPFVEAQYPVLAEGVQFRPNVSSHSELNRAISTKCQSRLMMSESFYGWEHWGAWMRGNFGEVVFQTNLPENTPIVVYVDIAQAAWFGECKLVMYLGDERKSHTRSLNQQDIAQNGLFKLTGHAGIGGNCKLCIEVLGYFGPPPPSENRHFAIGLRGIGYARTTNLEARADLLESFTFGFASSSVP